MGQKGAGGDRLVADRYRLAAILGRGGVGAVWEGRDEVLGRRVAVKEIPLEGSDGSAGLRALREAQAAARLDHPAVATIFDVLEEDGSVYIVMEVVEGRPLSRVVADEGPFRPERAAAIGVQMVDALSAAHAQGIIHRDVKPGNVLLDDQDRVHLTDFGIARFGDATLTTTGTVFGTPSYMAPEQAWGRESGAPADVWGLGASLYHLVEGVAPFSGSTPIATARAVAGEPPRPMEAAGPLAPLIERTMAKEPEARPDLDEVRAVLEAVSRGAGQTETRPLAATQPDDTIPMPLSPAPVRAPSGGGPGLATVAVWVLVLAAALAVFLLLRSGPEEEERAPGIATSVAAQPGAVPADWATHEKETYRVRVPPDWAERQMTPFRFDYVDPTTGAYLRVEWTDQPGDDPATAWHDLSERFSRSRENYREIRIESTTYRGHPAAVWEFTYTEDGVDLHAVDLGFVTGQRGYALFFLTPEEHWKAMSPMFEQFKAGFQIKE